MLDNFFHTISKWTIIIPLGILLMVLLLLPEKKQNVSQTKPPTISDAAVSPMVTTGSKENILKNIDLSKSYICNYASMSAYIKNKKIHLETKSQKKTSYTLFDQDCLYQWESGMFTGEKTCGLGQYVSIFENLSKFGLAGTSDVLPTFLKLAGDKVGTNEARVKNFVNSCKQTEIKDGKIFEVPKNVLFKNKKLS